MAVKKQTMAAITTTVLNSVVPENLRSISCKAHHKGHAVLRRRERGNAAGGRRSRL